MAKTSELIMGLRSPNPQEQVQAAYQLRYVTRYDERQQATDALFTSAYEGMDELVRITACQTLAIIAPDKAMEAFRRSTFHRNLERRRRGYENLGALGRKTAIEHVIRGLQDPEETVRAAAVLALGRLGDERTSETLTELLRGYEPKMVQNAITTALGLIHSRSNPERAPLSRPAPAAVPMQPTQTARQQPPIHKPGNSGENYGAYIRKGF